MTRTLAMLAILTAGGLSPVLADPPVPDAPAETHGAAAQKSSDAETHTNSPSPADPATPAATAATTPRVATTPPTPSASDEPQEEKLLRQQGYKPAMRNGEKVFCKREIPTGSLLPSALHCFTVQEAAQIAKEGRKTAERMQPNSPGCLPNNAGGCRN